MAELLGPSRAQYVASVRMLLMLEVRETFINSRTGRPLPLEQVAALFGRTDHKTAHHAVATGRATHEAEIAARREKYFAKLSPRWRRSRPEGTPRMQGGLVLAAGCSRQLSFR